jgi:hypothetical protein
MGGIVFHKGEDTWFEDPSRWDDEDIKNFFKLKLTKRVVQDRSKADGLSKAFVIVECLWFLAQCIARGVRKISLTELEVTGLAFIACNFGMYCFWWNKPLDVICPIEIQRPCRIRSKETEESRFQRRNPVLAFISAVVTTLDSGDFGTPSLLYLVCH